VRPNGDIECGRRALARQGDLEVAAAANDRREIRSLPVCPRRAWHGAGTDLYGEVRGWKVTMMYIRDEVAKAIDVHDEAK
jgi:hypothetical protein